MLALYLVAGLHPERAGHWQQYVPRATHTFLTTAQAAEEAVVFDGRCLPWLRGKLDEVNACISEVLGRQVPARLVFEF